MSCSCDNVLTLNGNNCDCHTPTYSVDPTYTGINVNIAVIEQKINVIKEEDAHIIELTPKYISYATFQALFYRQSTDFHPLTGVIGTEWQPFLSNAARQILYSSFSNANEQFGSYHLDFNLYNTITTGYENDLSISMDCWDTCSIVDFTTTLGNIKYLTDIGNECNIKCSITLDDFFNGLEVQGLVIDTVTGLPLDPSGNSIIYTGLVNAIITANFRSCTPGVKDIKIKWPFLINFNSVIQATADGSNNHVNGLPAVDGSNNTWPNIYFGEDASGSKTVPTVYRSPGLAYDTVDSSGNPAVKGAAGNTNPTKLPSYGRYTAYNYSSIKIKYN